MVTQGDLILADLDSHDENSEDNLTDTSEEEEQLDKSEIKEEYKATGFERNNQIVKLKST